MGSNPTSPTKQRHRYMADTRHSLSYSPEEFEREARRIDALTFETLALADGESVIFCGFTGGGDYIRRALEIGCKVAVIEAREDVIRANRDLGVRIVRGSTSVIPARESAFDAAIAVGYLHEVDPSFHSQILSELAGVARRVGIVELAPPSDPLGRRIAALYSRAKREFGSFEHYQTMDYWKKLLSIVKAEISQTVFQFGKLPPIEYLIDTVDLLLDTIEAEEAPEEDVDELRRIAKRSDAMLLPQARLVLVGASAGEIPSPKYSPATNVQTESVLTVLSSAAAAAVNPTAATEIPGAATYGPPQAPAAPAQPPAAAAPATLPPPVEAMPLQPPAPQPVVPPPAPVIPPAPAASTIPPSGFPQAAPGAPPPVPAGASPFGPPPNPANPFGLPDTQSQFGLGGAIPPGATPPGSDQGFGLGPSPFPVQPAPGSSPFSPPPAPRPTGPGWSWEPPEDDLESG